MIFDTSVWIELFRGTSEGLRVAEILKKDQIITSVVSLAEIRGWFAKHDLPFDAFLTNLKASCVFVPLHEEIALQAGILHATLRKVDNSFGMIDAIIYATARYYNQVLLTKDNHFRALDSVEML